MASTWHLCFSLSPSLPKHSELLECHHAAVREPKLVQVKRLHEEEPRPSVNSQHPPPDVNEGAFRESQPPAFSASSWDPDIAEQTQQAIFILPWPNSWPTDSMGMIHVYFMPLSLGGNCYAVIVLDHRHPMTSKWWKTSNQENHMFTLWKYISSPWLSSYKPCNLRAKMNTKPKLTSLCLYLSFLPS